MKNKFLIICSILCSFLFVDKVSAITDEMITNNAIDFYSDVFKERFESELFKSNSNLEEFDSKLKEDYDLFKNTYPYYMTIINCNDSRNCSTYVYYFKSNPSITFLHYKDTSNVFTIGYSNKLDSIDVSYHRFNFGSGYGYLTNFNDLTTETYSKNKNISFHFFPNNQSMFKIENKHYTNLYPCQILYDSNFDVTLGYSTNSSTINYDIKIGNNYYQGEDILPSYKSTLQPIIPAITTNLENTKFDDDNNVIQKKLTVDYGIYDFDKYRYEYTSNRINDKNNSDNFFWLPYLNSSPLEILINNNDTYFFRVLDKNTGDYITGGSINISGIHEIVPYIVFENLNDDECILKYENTDYQVCDLIRVYAKNIDYGNYELQYSYDFKNWSEHTGIDNYKIYIRDNGTIAFRIMNLSTNELVDSMTYTLTKLTFPNSNIPFIKFTTDCLDNAIGANIRVNLYNYNRDNYKFFYKTSKDLQFIEKVVTQDGNNFYKSFSLTDKTTLYIKIIDLEGNYVTGGSFTYTGVLCRKDDFDINNIDDINDFVLNEESTSNELFAQILNVSYSSAPKRLIVFVKIFLILTLVGAVLYLVGWK